MSNVDMCEHDWPGSGCKECRAEALACKITAPTVTPAMPVKAYYHEAPNDYGGLDKSVGLEVRKEFADAPLVLESDAMTRIACLEGEIAKRDARIVELELEVALRDQALDRHAEYGKQLRAELAAIKAQGVVMPERQSPDDEWHSVMKDRATGWNACLDEVARLSAAPVQQVSVPDGWKLVPVEPTPEMLASTTASKHEGLRAEVMRMAAEDYRAMLAAAPAAPAADAGLVAVEWAKDAEEWGPALNEAGWLFLSELNEDPQKSALIFNSTKGPLRAAIMKYAEIVAANAKDSSHD